MELFCNLHSFAIMRVFFLRERKTNLAKVNLYPKLFASRGGKVPCPGHYT
jgi:hypothetical protein